MRTLRSDSQAEGKGDVERHQQNTAKRPGPCQRFTPLTPSTAATSSRPLMRRMGATVLAFGAGLWLAACCGVSSSGACLRSSTVTRAAEDRDTDQLREWLTDERSWVREEAALAAGRGGLVELVPDLQARLLDPRERPWVRAAAASGLGALSEDDRAGVDAQTLASVAFRPDTPPEVKIALVDAVCRSDSARGTGLIAGLAKDTDALVAAVARRRTETQCRP